MKLLPFILLAALIGCSRQAPPVAGSQVAQHIRQWVPKGTRLAAVRRTMEQHHFVCTVGSYDSRAVMPPGSDPRWWDTGSFITSSGRTLPVTNVTILTCQRTDTNGEVWAYDATFMTVDGEFDGVYTLSARRVR